MNNGRSIFLLAVMTAFSMSLTARQSNRPGFDGNVLNPLWYQSTGFSSLASGQSDIARLSKYTGAMINPATLSFPSTTINVEFPWRHTTTDIRGYAYDQSTTLPSFFAAGFPSSFGYFQIGYARPYDEKMTSEEIPITTEEHPNGTGEYFRAVKEGAVHTAFAAFSFSPLDYASVGLTVGLDYIRQRSSILQSWVLYSGYRYKIITGITVRPIAGIDLGLVARYAPPVDLQESNNTNLKVVGGIDYRMEARSPFEFELGTSIQMFPSLAFMVSLQHENWVRVFDGATSLWQFRLGAEYHALSGCWLQLGYFTQSSPFPIQEAYYNQEFLTVGVRVCIIDSFELALSFMSSRPFVLDDGYNISSYFSFSFERSFYRDEIRIGMTYSL